MTEQVRPIESPPSPESIAPHRAMVGLQARLLMKPSAVNPDAKVAEVTKEHLLPFDQRFATYQRINAASKGERKQYWKEKGIEDFDRQKQQWIVNTVKTFQNAKDFFSSQSGTGKEWREVFSRLGIQAQDFTREQADQFYNRYFSGDDPKLPPINKFMQDVLNAHTTTNNGEKIVDEEKLRNNLPAVRWLAGIFGGNSAEIVEQMMDAEITIHTDPQSLIAKANEKQPDPKNPEEQILRVNNLEKRERELLSFLWNAKGAVDTTTPTPPTRPTQPTESPSDTTTPPTETTPPPNEEITPAHPDWEKLKEYFGVKGEEILKNTQKIRDTFMASEISKKGLPVYYPGSQTDISYPLMYTDADRFIFDDFTYVKANGEVDDRYTPDRQIADIGGTIKDIRIEGVLGQGGKRIITFDWGGKTRTVILYAEDATKFIPNEVKDGISLLIIKAPSLNFREGTTEQDMPGYLMTPESQAMLLGKIAVGGFYHHPPTKILPPETIGFDKVLDTTTPRKPYTYPLFQKIREEPHLKELLEIDSPLEWAVSVRNGEYYRGISASTIANYQSEFLEKKVRALYDKLPQEAKDKLQEPLRSILIPDKFGDKELEILRKYDLTTDEAIRDYLEKVREAGKAIFPELAA